MTPRHPSVQCDHTPVHVRHWHGSGLRQGAELFRDKDAYTATGMRLMVVPLLTWAVMCLLPLSNPLIASIVLITVAMPAPRSPPFWRRPTTATGALPPRSCSSPVCSA